MAKYTLNDLENLTGIKADTIRIWELRHRILKPHRTSTNRRWYTDTDLLKLLNINILYRQGLKISEIAGMQAGELKERAAMLAEGNTSINDDILSLLFAMNRLDKKLIDSILLKSIANKGFEETFATVVFPFLNKVGMLWLTGSVDPGTEHFITAIFRKRLIAAIDGIQRQQSPTGKKLMLFLPEGEWHEISLLFLAWLGLKKGHEILYLGQSTPIHSVFATAEKWKPDAVITGTITRVPVENPFDYLKRLAKGLKGIKIFAGGSLSEIHDKPEITGVTLLSGISDEKLMLYLENKSI